MSGPTLHLESSKSLDQGVAQPIQLRLTGVDILIGRRSQQFDGGKIRLILYRGCFTRNIRPPDLFFSAGTSIWRGVTDRRARGHHQGNIDWERISLQLSLGSLPAPGPSGGA